MRIAGWPMLFSPSGGVSLLVLLYIVIYRVESVGDKIQLISNVITNTIFIDL
jgi:hypothetical protein